MLVAFVSLEIASQIRRKKKRRKEGRERKEAEARPGRPGLLPYLCSTLSNCVEIDSPLALVYACYHGDWELSPPSLFLSFFNPSLSSTGDFSVHIFSLEASSTLAFPSSLTGFLLRLQTVKISLQLCHSLFACNIAL